MKELKQTKNLVKREFRITESKLFYSVSKFGNENEVDIPFENINGEKTSYKETNHTLLLFAIIIYLVGIGVVISLMKNGTEGNYGGLIWFGIASLLLILYWMSRKNFWRIRLANDSYLYIHKNIPSQNEADKFIQELIKSRNTFLKESYASIDQNLGYENQLNNLKWLKSINAITKKEYDDKYSELKQSLNPNKEDIGFGK